MTLGLGLTCRTGQRTRPTATAPVQLRLSDVGSRSPQDTWESWAGHRSCPWPEGQERGLPPKGWGEDQLQIPEGCRGHMKWPVWGEVPTRV